MMLTVRPPSYTTLRQWEGMPVAPRRVCQCTSLVARVHLHVALENLVEGPQQPEKSGPVHRQTLGRTDGCDGGCARSILEKEGAGRAEWHSLWMGLGGSTARRQHRVPPADSR